MPFAYSVGRILKIVGHNAKLAVAYTGELFGIAPLSTVAAGDSFLGNGAIWGSQAGVTGHLKLGSRAIVAGASGVSHSLEPNEKVFWPNGETFALYNRISVLQRRLSELFKRFSKLEKSVDFLVKRRITQ